MKAPTASGVGIEDDKQLLYRNDFWIEDVLWTLV